MNPAEIGKKERRIPVKAAKAFHDAFDQALSAGLSVVVAEEGKLIRIHPNGKREKIKSIPRRSRIEPGSLTAIRWTTESLD